MKTFELKEEHIKLLKNVAITWNDCEFGAPEINPKRPYGNSGSQVYYDMMDILGIEQKEDYEGEIIITKEVGEYLDKIHKELEIALQIILLTSSFKTGIYERESEYFYDGWKLVKEINNKK